MQWLKSLPGVEPILSATLASAIVAVHRFASQEHLASYAGTTPRVHGNVDKLRFDRLRLNVNRYLEWAHVEAANVIVHQQACWIERHVMRLYQRLRDRKGHVKAVRAVARHLAKTSFWVLQRRMAYRDPSLSRKGMSNPV